jgi:hypothetical protein
LLAIVALGGLLVCFVPPWGAASVMETLAFAWSRTPCERCFVFAFDFSVYLDGVHAMQAGRPAFDAVGYLYPNPLARLLAPWLGAFGGDEARLTAAHALATLALWPTLALLTVWSFQRTATRWIAAGVVYAAYAFREALELGNVEFEVLLAVLLAYRLRRAGRWVVPGVLLGIAVAVKPTAVLVPWGIAAAAAARGWRGGEDWRVDAKMVGVSAAVCLALLARDPAVTLAFVSGGPMDDISGRCRGVGLGTLLRAGGLECVSAVRVSLLAGIASVGAWAAWRGSQAIGWASGGMAQPVANALTSAYSFSFALLAWIPALERLEEEASSGEPPVWALVAALIPGAMLVSTNGMRLGLGAPVIGSAVAVVAWGVLVWVLRGPSGRAQLTSEAGGE